MRARRPRAATAAPGPPTRRLISGPELDNPRSRGAIAGHRRRHLFVSPSRAITSESLPPRAPCLTRGGRTSPRRPRRDHGPAGLHAALPSSPVTPPARRSPVLPLAARCRHGPPGRRGGTARPTLQPLDTARPPLAWHALEAPQRLICPYFQRTNRASWSPPTEQTQPRAHLVQD